LGTGGVLAGGGDDQRHRDVVDTMSLATIPNHADWLRVGGEFSQSGEHPKALWCYEHLDDGPDKLRNRISTLIFMKQFDEARDLAITYTARYPSMSDAWDAAACVEMGASDFSKSEEFLNRAISLDNTREQHWANLGFTYQMLGRYEDAERAWGQALQINPLKVELHTWIGMIQMAQGKWREGIARYDARFLHANPLPQNGKPIWRGESLKGKTIMLWKEQGAGDSVQFVRYAPLLKEAWGARRVIVACQDNVYRMLRLADGVDEVVTTATPDLPQYDCHTMMLGVLGPILNTLGEPGMWDVNIPYIHVNPMPRVSDRFSVGLCWQGNPHHHQDRFRSIPQAALEPLVLDKTLDINWVSAQNDCEITLPLERFESTDLLNFTQHLKALDLVITVDTAVAHVCGACGIPCWMLLPFVSDWRWNKESERTPWYPGIRIFKQERLMEWEPVISRVTEELRRRQNV
jgi:tetratricopeptide (TPR) repeat protein